ncbi:B12-binding domain-containing radical SAM protein [Rhodopila sp.]|uniref:B12-binding domain-containing radical SAM protein n=1 Tax=Rhodopila sp. TaxID=2480087 RepID=UPI002C65D2F1|nr:radical SAM protein [Rhodopila sp.]HVZ10248.1 radical SAM protein [Rhodopila sp.]
MARTFHVEMIKPSHYDDDGYVIQWWKASIPSNSLASLYAIVQAAAETRPLGEDVTITFDGWDECNTVISERRVVARIRKAGAGIVFLVGVQSNQFPRALDLGRVFRAQGIDVMIGGFHVSGCLSMLPTLPADLREALDLGITLFAGEAEDRIADLLRDAQAGALKPIYNYLKDLPNLEGAVAPFLPAERLRRYSPPIGSFDAGRGCPFQCSFCTIINVQGRKSRHRSADDVEALLRAHLEKGVTRFFITDDDFARNRNWEEILDRIIEMREREGLQFGFLIQVDAQAYRIPGFVEKCKRAGCSRVFIGLETINAANLLHAKKRQNKIGKYREMLQAWRAVGIITFCGYILGFPEDTVESIRHDIETLKRELPVDCLEFFILTPLPGSEDHQKLTRGNVPMNTDMNQYDLEHVCTAHARMSEAEWEGVYQQAWTQYYSLDHMETLLRRAVADGLPVKRLMLSLVVFCGMPLIEKIHPLQGGYIRRRIRRSRRPGSPASVVHAVPPLFYLWHWSNTFAKLLRLGRLLWQVNRVRKRIEAEHLVNPYTDIAITRLSPETEAALEMLQERPALEAAAE